MYVFFLFLIRNEEDYINKRTNTGEKKETKEREKNQGKDERSFLHKYQGKMYVWEPKMFLTCFLFFF